MAGRSPQVTGRQQLRREAHQPAVAGRFSGQAGVSRGELQASLSLEFFHARSTHKSHRAPLHGYCELVRAVALFIGLGPLSFLITVFVPPLGVLLVAIPAVVLAGLWLRRNMLEDSEFERAARRAPRHIGGGSGLGGLREAWR